MKLYELESVDISVELLLDKSGINWFLNAWSVLLIRMLDRLSFLSLLRFLVVSLFQTVGFDENVALRFDDY